jgi:signal transduction histidine kinase
MRSTGRRRTTLRRILAHSFATRLAVATSGLIVLACVALSVILVRRDLAVIHRSLEERALTISELLVRESELSMLSGNEASLQQLAAVALAEHDVVYCRFFDAQGQLLVAVGTVPSGAPREPAGDGDGDGPITVAPAMWEFQSPILSTQIRARGEELAFPESGFANTSGAGVRRRIGTVAIGVALGPLFELRRSAYLTTAFFAALVALLASGSALLLARAFTRPLQVLAVAADAVGRGDLQISVPIQSEDEVASVARSFNAMVASLAESRAKLEEYSRTLEVRTKRLEVLNRQLEEASRLKSEFLAQISHELRTPLHVIIGYSQMLADEAAGPVTAEQRELLEAIDRYSHLQLDLVTDVLDLSRLASGRFSFHVERFTLWSLLAEVLQLQQSTLERPDLHVMLDVAPDVPEMETDRVKLQEIVRNLVDNAFKFTATGTVGVTGRRRADAEHVVIEVSDTGTGIPAEYLDTVFDEFRQLGETSTRATAGVGLGLTIVKQLVAALGGTVSLSSTVGQGSTFRVDIPSHLPDELRAPKRPALTA